MSISIAIFVSGRGSNMKAILEAKAQGTLDVEIAAVVSNNPDAAALEIARQHNVPTLVVSHKKLTREEHETLLLQALAPYRIDFVVLAGYMRILTSKFLQSFRHPAGYFKVINIHPSLLPAFPGANGYEDAFSYGVRVAGITVHLVDEQVDHGPILAQETFPRYLDDTLETFKARGLALEHRLFPAVLQQLVLDGGVKLPVAMETTDTSAAVAALAPGS